MAYRSNKSSNYRKHSNKNTEVVIDESNAIIQSFRLIAKELDDKHDRYERIVKLSRDITIESKRIIFLLHTVDIRNEKNCDKILSEAKTRLDTVCKTNFIQIGKELIGLDPYQYARAYSAGLQEFIEAYTFFQYISGSKITDWVSIQEELSYEQKIQLEEKDTQTTNDDGSRTEEVSNKFICLIQPTEYMLGLADMSGEVMRRGINALGNGNINVCVDSSQFLQQLYMGFLRINGVSYNREMGRKISTLRQSLLKTEMVCYNIKVRGGEAAKWGLESSSQNYREGNEEDDEGFY